MLTDFSVINHFMFIIYYSIIGQNDMLSASVHRRFVEAKYMLEGKYFCTKTCQKYIMCMLNGWSGISEC